MLTACWLCCAGPQARAQEAVARDDGGGSLFSRLSRWVDDHPRRWAEDLRDEGVYPRLSSFAPGTGMAPGVDYWRPVLARGNLGLLASAAHSFRGDSLFQVRFGRFPRPAKVLNPRTGYPSLEALAPFPGPHSGEASTFFYVEAMARELESGRIYTSDGQAASYRANDSSFELVGGYVLAPGLAVSARLGSYESRVNGLNQGYDPTLVPSFGKTLTALGHETEYTRVNVELAWDTRDVVADPRSGSFLSLAWWGYHDRTHGGSYGFQRFEADARRFQPLGSERHVLALHGWASLSDPGGGGVPFNLQQSLGGSRILRGYPGHRFQGHDVLAASAEYRLHVHPRVELAAFYDVGRVSGGLAEREPTDLLSSWGGGIRLKSRGGVLLRLDVGKGHEGVQAHVKFGYSF
jgi:hypothetical protein